jgi:hypothetical protein
MHPDAQIAYENDPKFHALVDAIHAYLRAAEYTPSEVRQAAMLACIHYERYQVHRPFIVAGDV